MKPKLSFHFDFRDMQLKIKALDKSEFTVEVDLDSDSIEQIKKKCQEAKNNDVALDPAISKLIWKGKILQNSQSAKEAGLNDKGFCVIMPGKVQKSTVGGQT